MLNRSQLLKLVGWDTERYKSLARRDLLPFAAPDRDLEGSRDGYWRKFTPFEALLAIMFEDLTRDGGLPLDRAARILGNSAQSIWAHWPVMIAGDPPLWLGYVWLGEIRDEGGFHVIGTLAEIEDRLRHGRKTEGGRFGPYVDMSRIALVNASYAAMRLRERVALQGIEVGRASPGPC